MVDVQYVIMVKPRASLGYPQTLEDVTKSGYDVWVVYGQYYSLHEAKRVAEELVKRVDADSFMLCKKVDKRMILVLG